MFGCTACSCIQAPLLGFPSQKEFSNHSRYLIFVLAKLIADSIGTFGPIFHEKLQLLLEGLSSCSTECNMQRSIVHRHG